MIEQIGRYEILDRVAAGGQGTVYRARDTVLDRVVAVKVINQPVADDPAYLEALQREARLAARLSHPNITTVYDFQVEESTAFIVMEYVPDALDRQLQGNKRLPWRRAIEIGLQTARALQHAHDQGVVHRDIKPQNILLRETGAAAVSDFGIARALASSTRSQTGGVMGTPAYMSPEQWDGSAVDSRLDQYGLGIVLYEVITGSPPFQGDSWGAMYVQHREAPVPPISSSLQVPGEVESVIRKMLEKSAEDRYGTAAELADALEGALTGGAAQGPSTEVSQPPRINPTRPAPPGALPNPALPVIAKKRSLWDWIGESHGDGFNHS
jgi:serine/threonine-protein kinase